jgi:hypothetical protein
VDTVDELSPEMSRIVAAKEKRRMELARLPYEEKIRIIVEMQKWVAPLYRARGIKVHVWGENNQGPN